MVNTPVLTVDRYKEGLERALKDSKRKAVVQDLYVIPNYTSFLEDSIDP